MDVIVVFAVFLVAMMVLGYLRGRILSRDMKGDSATKTTRRRAAFELVSPPVALVAWAVRGVRRLAARLGRPPA